MLCNVRRFENHVLTSMGSGHFFTLESFLVYNTNLLTSYLGAYGGNSVIQHDLRFVYLRNFTEVLQIFIFRG